MKFLDAIRKCNFEDEEYLTCLNFDSKYFIKLNTETNNLDFLGCPYMDNKKDFYWIIQNDWQIESKYITFDKALNKCKNGKIISNKDIHSSNTFFVYIKAMYKFAMHYDGKLELCDESYLKQYSKDKWYVL